MKNRKSSVQRKTRETDIKVEINLDGTGSSRISTGIPFMDHMLELLSRHSLIDMKITAKGDTEVDYHHTVEDLGLTIGQALNKALGERKGICRYGYALLPMDECLCQTAVDLGGRPFLVYSFPLKRRKIVDFDVHLVEEFIRAFTMESKINTHVCFIYGKEPHHACEAVFKSLARALRTACSLDGRERGIPSSKGRI